GRLQIVHPETQIVEGVDADRHAADTEARQDSVLPVYHEIEPIRPVQLRRIVQAALAASEALPEVLPAALLGRHGLPPLDEAIRRLHAPPLGADLVALN